MLVQKGYILALEDLERLVQVEQREQEAQLEYQRAQGG